MFLWIFPVSLYGTSNLIQDTWTRKSFFEESLHPMADHLVSRLDVHRRRDVKSLWFLMLFESPMVCFATFFWWLQEGRQGPPPLFQSTPPKKDPIA